MAKIQTALGLLLSYQISCLPAAAQAFQDLSTTADGSILYFASPVRQKGTDQKLYSKIFRWTAAGGVQVVAGCVIRGHRTLAGHPGSIGSTGHR